VPAGATASTQRQQCTAAAAAAAAAFVAVVVWKGMHAQGRLQGQSRWCCLQVGPMVDDNAQQQQQQR
jgi:hypothetical protein